jgi:hypothetical protein
VRTGVELNASGVELLLADIDTALMHVHGRANAEPGEVGQQLLDGKPRIMSRTLA